MSDNNSIAAIRKVYQLESLLEKDLDPDPIKQFANWWQQAIESKIDEPNAMALATCAAAVRPSVRSVLLKGREKNSCIFL